MSALLDDISNAAKTRFAQIPFPHKKDEYWRFSDLNAWSADALFPHFSQGVPKSGEDAQVAEIAKSAAQSALAFFDGQLVSANVPDGVKVVSMADGAEKYSAEVSEFFGAAKGKFDTVAAARAYNGAVVVVADGADATLDMAVVSKLGLSVCSILFLVGKNARLRLARNFALGGGSFGIAMSKFALSDGSRLELGTHKYSGAAAHSYLRDDFRVSAGVSVVDAYAELGLSPSRAERNFEIVGEGADIDARAFLKTTGELTHDLRTSQMHRVGGAASNLTVKCVVDGNSKAAFAGLIRVEEGAQKTKAYQSCRSLSLSDFAKTQASPVLEIMANDVECSHGCTVSKPDPEELFYMNQRGLNTAEALELITESFAKSTFEKFGGENQ